MARQNGRQRSPEEAAWQEKIHELLALCGVEGLEDRGECRIMNIAVAGTGL